MTLHLLRRVYDKMIDGQPEDYESFWQKLDTTDSYSSVGAFRLGMMYDEENPSSVLSSLNRAMDNAIMLREDIKSETMSYIEMSISLMKQFSNNAESNITNLQPVTDWMLAFRGSVAHRIEEPRVLALIAMGQAVEQMDVMLRFCYCYERIAKQYNVMATWAKVVPGMLDEHICAKIEEMLKPESYANADDTFRWTLCKYINNVVRA